METYILTRTMHLGYIKETFGRGAVIKFDPEKRTMSIDGRRFDDWRDIEILKRQSIKTPHNPFIIMYSPEALAEMRGEGGELEPAIPQRVPNGEGMPIVRSDEDSHETIDIRHTKVGANNQAKKEADRQRIKDNSLEIIRGDESVEERIARLKTAKDTDLSARAERVRLMSERSAKMPVIHDDSLGAASGTSSAMNAGTRIGGRRAEETPDTVKTAAEMRKQEAEARRVALLEEEGLPGDMDIDVGPTPVDEVPSTVPATDDKDAEIAALRAALAAKNAPKPEPVVDPRDAEIAALKAELEGDAPVAPPKAQRVPVPADQADLFGDEEE